MIFNVAKHLQHSIMLYPNMWYAVSSASLQFSKVMPPHFTRKVDHTDRSIEAATFLSLTGSILFLIKISECFDLIIIASIRV